MRIIEITVSTLSVPLYKPFITARRTAAKLESVLVTVRTDEGWAGYGEAPVITAVTGETSASINAAVTAHIAPNLIGMDICDLRMITKQIQGSMYGNPSAKSAVECAVYDLFARMLHKPLYNALGGNKQTLANDITVSVNNMDEMTADCLAAAHNGHRIIKIKLGKTPTTDKNMLISIWRTLDTQYPDIRIRIDANQGWKPKEAVRIINVWEDAGIPVEFVEQPVPSWDITGLSMVTKHTETPIMADESVFSMHDAARLLETHAADLVNIKLAKMGGVSNALAVADLCCLYNVPCMMGCMLESRLGVSYAAHVAAAHDNIIYTDLDGPLLCAEDPFTGGPVFEGADLCLTDDIGVGLHPAAAL